MLGCGKRIGECVGVWERLEMNIEVRGDVLRMWESVEGVGGGTAKCGERYGKVC